MELIPRDNYLSWLCSWQDKPVIKVVSGVRRCGKSTLFKIYQDHLRAQGVENSQILSINFEDLAFEDISTYEALYSYILEHLATGRTTYVFLDEIQHVQNFEKAVDSLFIRDDVDLYITGSNAYLMSGELATLLSGRYVELKMLPLSFAEFCSVADDGESSRNVLFEGYLARGAFPMVSEMRLDEAQAAEYMRNLYSTILLKDVVQRLEIRDVTSLENVARYLLQNIGNKVSLRKISDTLVSSGRKVDQKTVGKYVRGLTDGLLLYYSPRYDLKGRQLLSTNGKYYAVDVGLRRSLVRGRESDVGHILENVVYLELLRRGYEVYVGDLLGGEIDFVAVNGSEVEYYQVSATTLDEDTLARELAPFRRLSDNYPKTLLTLDEAFGSMDYEGVQKRNAIGWLLGE